MFVDRINVPPPKNLPGTDDPMDFVLLGDEAFPLQKNLLRPFAGRDLNTMVKKRFNYRLSRARRMIENAFGEFKLCMIWYKFVSICTKSLTIPHFISIVHTLSCGVYYTCQPTIFPTKYF